MKRLCWYLLTEIFHQRSKFFGPAICWWILLSLDHAKETGTRGLTTKCGVVMKGGIVLVIIQLSTSMVGMNYLLLTGSVQVPFGHSSEITSLYFMKCCSKKVLKKNSLCDFLFFFTHWIWQNLKRFNGKFPQA